MEIGHAENVIGMAVGALDRNYDPWIQKKTNRSFTNRQTREASTLYLYPACARNFKIPNPFVPYNYHIHVISALKTEHVQ